MYQAHRHAVKVLESQLSLTLDQAWWSIYLWQGLNDKKTIYVICGTLYHHVYYIVCISVLLKYANKNGFLKSRFFPTASLNKSSSFVSTGKY